MATENSAFNHRNKLHIKIYCNNNTTFFFIFLLLLTFSAFKKFKLQATASVFDDFHKNVMAPRIFYCMNIWTCSTPNKDQTVCFKKQTNKPKQNLLFYLQAFFFCRLEKCPSYDPLAMMSCWRVPKNSCDGKRGLCRIEQSHAVALHRLRWPKAWWETDWRHSLMLIGSDNRDAAFSAKKMYLFFYLISCDYVFKLRMNIPKHCHSAISV